MSVSPARAVPRYTRAMTSVDLRRTTLAFLLLGLIQAVAAQSEPAFHELVLPKAFSQSLRELAQVPVQAREWLRPQEPEQVRRWSGC